MGINRSQRRRLTAAVVNSGAEQRSRSGPNFATSSTPAASSRWLDFEEGAYAGEEQELQEEQGPSCSLSLLLLIPAVQFWVIGTEVRMFFHLYPAYT